MKYHLTMYLVAFMMLAVLHEKAFVYPPLCNMDISGGTIKGFLSLHGNKIINRRE